MVVADLEVASTRREEVKPFTRRMKNNPREEVLADYIFRLGLGKQASDYELVSQFTINHIR
jgi:hypothetical protein